MKKAIFLLSIFLLAFTTCKKDTEEEEKLKDPSVDFMEYSNEGKISAGGGKVQITDANSTIKNAFVEIPSSTLSSAINISIGKPNKLYQFEGKSEGYFVEFGPSGTKFEKPVTIGIPYSQNQNPDSLQVFFFNEIDSIWLPLKKTSVDRDRKLVLAQTNHFTIVTAQKSTFQFDLDLFQKNNVVYAKVWFLASLLKVATNPTTMAGYGCQNIQDLFKKSPLTVHMCYKISLKEKVDWWTDKTIDSREIIYGVWRYNNFTTYEIRAQDSKGTILLETNDKFLDINKLEEFCSGRPLIVNFPNAQLESTKQYYLDVELFFADSWGGVSKSNRYFSYGIFVSSNEVSKSLSQMLNPQDVDGDGIINSYDPVNGNPPASPSNPNPTNNATGISTSPSLIWDCSDPDGDALTYDVYFGTDNPPASKVSTAQNGKSLARNGLADGKNYYWKVVASDGKGNITESPVWKFTTTPAANQPPATPSNPNPTNNATGISTSPTLTWDCSDPDNDPINYDVYFGSDNPPITKVATDQTAKTLSRSSLDNNTPYYWKVTAKDNKGNSTPGTVWKFTTQPVAGSAPVADFTSSKTSITKGETIQFTDKSTNNPTSWLWSFGDGTTSTVQNATKTYNAAGTYTVSLKATNGIGNNTKTRTNYIEVTEISNSAPVTDFTASKTNITKGETIQFTDKSTNSPTSWLWDFGDGTSSTFQNPTHDYATTGNYTVSLKATNSSGNNTKTMSIKVSEPTEIKYGEMVYDGRTYKTVIINGKEWMAENLAYLPSVIPSSAGSYTEPYYYVHGYEGTNVIAAKATTNYTIYGVLYNWPAANAACPPGWHLPSDDEWTVLENYLIANGYNYDGTTTKNKIAKSMAATTNWSESSRTGDIGNNFSLNNKSGFSALPGGYTYGNGGFHNITYSGGWWSATEYSTTDAWCRELFCNSEYLFRRNKEKKWSCSVRYVRD